MCSKLTFSIFKVLFAAIIFEAAFFLGTASNVDNKELDDAHTKQIKHLGTANGKSFFLDDTVELSWTDALSYCASHNMSLASFQTAEQAMMVVQAIQRFGQNRFFTWTSARYYPPPSDYLWEDTKQFLNTESVVSWGGSEFNFRCVRLGVARNNAEWWNFASADCSQKLRPLCAAS